MKRIRPQQIFVVSLMTVFPIVGLAEEPVAGTSERPETSLSQEGEELAKKLAASLPEGSEARAMYDDIISGSRLGPTDGWFRLATAQTRFNWDAVSKQLDADSNGSIEPQEFAGEAKDFQRLDRNGDRRITAEDLEWSAPAQDRDEAMALYRPADANSDGRITADEFSTLFNQLDQDKLGFVTLDDLRGYFARAESAEGRRGRGPSREILLKGLARQEIGSLQSGPGLNEKVRDFTLKTFDGQDEVTLSDEIGSKPVVLVFGNFTCGPFRSQSGNIEKLYERYKDRATFLMVYVREAHPVDGWHMESNAGNGVEVVQPKTYDERVAIATACQGRLDFSMPFLVDTIDDEVGAAYSGMPSRLYVIDGEGKVAYKSGRGPHGFKPAEMEQSLLFLLAETESDR